MLCQILAIIRLNRDRIFYGFWSLVSRPTIHTIPYRLGALCSAHDLHVRQNERDVEGSRVNSDSLRFSNK